MLPQPPALGQGEIPAFAYSTRLADIPVRMKQKAESERWIRYELKFQVKDFAEGKNKYAKAFYYVQKDQSRKVPCLIVLPPTGGPRDLVTKIAEPFADKGFTVMAFYRRERFFKPDKPIEYNKHLFQQAVIDVRRGIDFFETRQDADSSRIGIMGLSLGGIVTALATEADGRIKASVSIVSAAHLPDVLDTSGYQVVRKLRKGIMKQENLSRQELKAYCTPLLVEIDPATYADRIDPGRMLMINGRSDAIIKYNVARRTWETYGKPEMIVTVVGHYGTIGSMCYTTRKSYDHFLSVLALEEDENGRVRPKNQ